MVYTLNDDSNLRCSINHYIDSTDVEFLLLVHSIHPSQFSSGNTHSHPV